MKWDRNNAPMVDHEGISDPVTIFTDNGMVLTGWWNANTGWWNCIESNGRDFDKETFGNVIGWVYIEFPDGWHYDKELYR